jgi:hypothetical protein
MPEVQISRNPYMLYSMRIPGENPGEEITSLKRSGSSTSGPRREPIIRIWDKIR